MIGKHGMKRTIFVITSTTADVWGVEEKNIILQKKYSDDLREGLWEKQSEEQKSNFNFNHTTIIYSPKNQEFTEMDDEE